LGRVSCKCPLTRAIFSTIRISKFPIVEEIRRAINFFEIFTNNSLFSNKFNSRR
jgi:hypothetical protein